MGTFAQSGFTLQQNYQCEVLLYPAWIEHNANASTLQTLYISNSHGMIEVVMCTYST